MSRYKVQNWSEYSKSLENRGDLFLWVDRDIAKRWKAKRQQGQVGAPQQYSDDAILCLMTLKVLFQRPYRQLVGFFTSFVMTMRLDVTVPHFTTIAEPDFSHYEWTKFGEHL